MIHFDEVLHKYTDDEGNDYISVTQLIGKYKQPFDTVRVSQNYAAKHGETPEYWQEKWEQTKNEACDRGNLFHEEKEDTLLGRGVDMHRGKPTEVFNPNLQIRVTSNIFDFPDGIYPELRMWHPGYRLAGTADKPLFETIDGIRYVDIDDHKTNKAIYTKSYYSPSTGFKMMQHPVEHLMDCNMVHYELQTSFYAYMFESLGFVVRDLQFTHYPHQKSEEEDPFNDTTPVEYPCRYLKAEVIAILEHHRKNNRRKR